MENGMTTTDIPEGFERHYRRSPVARANGTFRVAPKKAQA
jgi:hypothetical protein